MENTETSGVVYPSVTIDGRVLRVCCSLYAEYQLSRAGLTLNDCLKIMGAKVVTGTRDARDVARVMDMFAACVAENYVHEDAPTADQWARKLSAADNWLDLFKQIDVAVGTAIKKRFPAVIPPAAQPENQPALTN